MKKVITNKVAQKYPTSGGSSELKNTIILFMHTGPTSNNIDVITAKMNC